MKRFAWLLVLPYVVSLSSGLGGQRNTLEFDKREDIPKLACIGSVEECTWIYDMAEALNAAHERRLQKEDYEFSRKMWIKEWRDEHPPTQPCGDHDPSYFGVRGCYDSKHGVKP
jgi:hypothetical protein